jgi:hypothetical protein
MSRSMISQNDAVEWARAEAGQSAGASGVRGRNATHEALHACSPSRRLPSTFCIARRQAARASSPLKRHRATASIDTLSGDIDRVTHRSHTRTDLPCRADHPSRPRRNPSRGRRRHRRHHGDDVAPVGQLPARPCSLGLATPRPWLRSPVAVAAGRIRVRVQHRADHKIGLIVTERVTVQNCLSSQTERQRGKWAVTKNSPARSWSWCAPSRSWQSSRLSSSHRTTPCQNSRRPLPGPTWVRQRVFDTLCPSTWRRSTPAPGLQAMSRRRSGCVPRLHESRRSNLHRQAPTWLHVPPRL